MKIAMKADRWKEEKIFVWCDKDFRSCEEGHYLLIADPQREMSTPAEVLDNWFAVMDERIARNGSMFARCMSVVNNVLKRTDGSLAMVCELADREQHMENFLYRIVSLQHPDEQSAVEFCQRNIGRISTLPVEWKYLFVAMLFENVFQSRKVVVVPDRYLDMCDLRKEETRVPGFYQAYADVYHDVWSALASSLRLSSAKRHKLMAAAYALDSASLIPYLKMPCKDEHATTLYLTAITVFAEEEQWERAVKLLDLCMSFSGVTVDQRAAVLSQRVTCYRALDRYDVALPTCTQLVSLNVAHATAANAPRNELRDMDTAASFLALGYLYAEMKQNDRALEAFRSALAFALTEPRITYKSARGFLDAFLVAREACADTPFQVASGLDKVGWRICTGCDAIGKRYLVCSCCRQAWYCTQACQHKHWPLHKVNCNCCAICRQRKGNDDPFYRCVGCGRPMCSQACANAPSHTCSSKARMEDATTALKNGSSDVAYSYCRVCIQPRKVQLVPCECGSEQNHRGALICGSVCHTIYLETMALSLKFGMELNL